VIAFLKGIAQVRRNQKASEIGSEKVKALLDHSQQFGKSRIFAAAVLSNLNKEAAEIVNYVFVAFLVG
jgi:hypothetical protein